MKTKSDCRVVNTCWNCRNFRVDYADEYGDTAYICLDKYTTIPSGKDFKEVLEWYEQHTVFPNMICDDYAVKE